VAGTMPAGNRDASLLDRWLWQYRRPLFYDVSVVERTPGAGNIPSRWVWLVVFDKIREASPASRSNCASLSMCGSLRIVDLRDENLSVPHDDESVQMGWSEWVPLLSTQQASDNRSVWVG